MLTSAMEQMLVELRKSNELLDRIDAREYHNRTPYQGSFDYLLSLYRQTGNKELLQQMLELPLF